MAAGVHGRARIGRSLIVVRDLASLPGWVQLLVTFVVACAIVLIAHFAGVPGHWAPLVFGGALGLMTALVAGAPQRDED
jgi:hypothetical protein